MYPSMRTKIGSRIRMCINGNAVIGAYAHHAPLMVVGLVTAEDGTECLVVIPMYGLVTVASWILVTP